MKPEIFAILLQSIGAALAIWAAYTKWSKDAADHRVEAAERMTRLESKVDILFAFWEKTMERRSAEDQKRWLEAEERRNAASLKTVQPQP